MVLNICAGTGEWRKAARVFKLMALNGVQPNTATFSTVASAIKRGPALDAAAMYEQMKLSGVPEYICYHAATKAIGKVRN